MEKFVEDAKARESASDDPMDPLEVIVYLVNENPELNLVINSNFHGSL